MSGAVLAAFLLALPHLTTIETPHFSFVHDSRTGRLARHLASRAEEIYAGLSREVGYAPRGRITIRVAGTPEQFRAMQPGNTAPWAQAVAYPAQKLIVIRGYGDLQPEATLAHELTHVMLQGALRGRPVPAWLAEGLAMHYGGQWSLQRWATLSKAMLFGSLIPLPELTHGFPQETARAQLAYAESHSLVGFIRREWGEAGLQRLARSLAAGRTPESALKAATGLPAAELERRWMRELKLRFSWVPIATSTTALWAMLMGLTVYVWRQRRLRARKILRQWEEEEEQEEAGGPA